MTEQQLDSGVGSGQGCRVPRCFVLFATLAACVPSSDDEATTAMNGTLTGSTDGDGGSGSVESSGGGFDTAGSTGAADSSTGAGDSSTSAADESGTGELECAAGNLPSEYGDIEGCGEVLGQPYCSEGQRHVDVGTDIDWLTDPPQSGPHFPSWEAWGEHMEPVERGYWVHNLEHGGIVLLYNCPDGCEADLEVLRAVVTARPDARLLLTPDANLQDTRFAAASWTWVHRFDTTDPDELLCFVDQHFNHAPEDVP